MNARPVTIRVQREGKSLLVALAGLLGEFEYDECEADLDAVLKRCEAPDVQNVVLDLGGVELFGSSAVGWFIELSHRIVPRGGQVVLSQVSEMGKEVLRASKLEHRWPLYETRDEALAALGERGDLVKSKPSRRG